VADAAAARPDSHAGEDVAFAALGTALAGGLVDLLRDRPGRRPTVRLTVPLHNGDTSIAATAEDPRIVVASAPHDYTEPIADLAWAPVERPARRIPAESLVSQSAAYTRPLDAAAPSQATPGDAPLEDAPLDTAAALPQNVRRRLVQRVIVRKLAMLDGQVVAESTVERQVPVVSDDQAMAAKVQSATLDAAREALSRLIREAPEEALPAIRMELYALDNRAFAQNVRRPGS
jgi:hypothetical protein